MTEDRGAQLRLIINRERIYNATRLFEMRAAIAGDLEAYIAFDKRY